MGSMSDKETYVVMSQYHTFGYTKKMCTFDLQYFSFNSFPILSLSIKMGHPRFLVFKCTFLSSYMVLISFYSRYELSLAVYQLLLLSQFFTTC